MSVRMHIVLMLVATLSSWIGWLLVIANINPFESSWWGFAFFYSTLFLSLFGTFTVLGYTVRSIIRMKRMTTRFKITTALRQSFLWSAALIIALALQGQRLLTWWIFLILLIVFMLIEFVSLTMRQRINNTE